MGTIEWSFEKASITGRLSSNGLVVYIGSKILKSVDVFSETDFNRSKPVAKFKVKRLKRRK